MDYMTPGNKFRFELKMRLCRMIISINSLNNVIELLKNGAPHWIYEDKVDKLLKTFSEDNDWIYSHQVLLLLHCPEAWVRFYPKILKLKKDLEAMGY